MESWGPYNWPYTWVTGVITLFITPLITGRGPTLYAVQTIFYRSFTQKKGARNPISNAPVGNLSMFQVLQFLCAHLRGGGTWMIENKPVETKCEINSLL